MLGAWNPQTFDVMALGTPQIVWNKDPVRLFDKPPPWEPTATGIAARVEDILGDPDGYNWQIGAEEVSTRHRWAHRAEAVLDALAEVVK
jgi:hypothetical protein